MSRPTDAEVLAAMVTLVAQLGEDEGHHLRHHPESERLLWALGVLRDWLTTPPIPRQIERAGTQGLFPTVLPE